MQQDGTADEESGKIYHGQAGYKNYIQVKESQIGGAKYTGTKGPIRAKVVEIWRVCRVRVIHHDTSLHWLILKVLQARKQEENEGSVLCCLCQR